MADENVKKDLETQLTNAQNTLNSATTAYDNVNAELTAEQSKLTKLKDDVTNAQKDSQNAIDAYKNAQTALDIANKEKTKEDETLSSLQQQLTDTKAAITKAEENVTSKKAALDALKGSKENLEKLVESTKAAYDAVQAQWNQGSLGYYESIGDTQAVDVIKEGMQLGTTDLNNEMAATSLDNMKKSLGMLDECNRLRKLNGLSELKTSGLMNAISQVKLNHTQFRQGSYDSPHTHLYGTSENLAAGYNWDVSGSDAENKGKGPFRGWYGHEKDVLDEFYKEHPEEVGTDPWELITRYDGLFNQIGHYLILLNTGSTVTGVSYLQRGEYDKEYGTGWFAQQFHYDTENPERVGLTSPIDSSKKYDNRIGQMTVSEFEAKFNKYYDSLKVDLESKKAAYEDAKKALDDAVTNKDVIANATKEYEDALAALETLKASQTTIEDQIKDAENAVSTATGKVTEAQGNVEKAEIVKNEKNAALTAAQARVDAQQKTVDSKASDIAKAKGKVEEATKAVENIEATIKESEQSAATLKKKLDAAIVENRKKETAFNNTSALVSDTKEVLGELNSEKSSKEAEKASVEVTLKQAEAAKATAKTDADRASNTLTSLKDEKSKREDLKANLNKNLESQEQINKSLAENAEALKNNNANSEKVNKDLVPLEEEAARLDKVLTMYQDIINGVMLINIEEDFLQDEEKALFDELRAAMAALDDAENNLYEAQQAYDAEKEVYDALLANVADAKAELNKAETALDEYLKPKPVPKPETKPSQEKVDSSVTTKKENTTTATNTTKTQDGKVNTAAEAALGFYALSGVLGLAGVAFTGKHARKED